VLSRYGKTSAGTGEGSFARHFERSFQRQFLSSKVVGLFSLNYFIRNFRVFTLNGIGWNAPNITILLFVQSSPQTQSLLTFFSLSSQWGCFVVRERSGQRGNRGKEFPKKYTIVQCVVHKSRIIISQTITLHSCLRTFCFRMCTSG